MVAISGNTPLLDSVIEVRRTTPRDIRLVDFVDGTVLKEFDLDLADTQMLFLIQEDTDTLADAILFDHVKDAWDMRGKRVANVGDPVENHDAVTLAYMQRYVAQFAGQGGGSGGNDPGSGGGGGSAYPPININIDDIKKEILRDVLRRIKGMEEEIRADVEEAANRIAEGLERLKNHNADVLRKAGFVIDETAGTATFQALEDFKTETGGRFSDVFQRLDAANAKIDLKASQAELDGTNTRLNEAEASLNAAKADILLKASQTEVDGLSQKITKAETDIDGLNSTINLRATKAELDGVNERLTAAEVFINANGGNLQNIVFDFHGVKERLEELAAGVASNASGLLTSEEKRRADIALAKTELTAKIEEASEETRQAVAAQKAELLSAIDNSTAGVDSKIKAVADSVTAEAQARQTLAAQVGENKASIETEAQTRVAETGALKAKYGVKVDAGGRVIGWEANNDSKSGTFDVYADNFRIYSPDAGKNAKPFHYDATTGKLKLQEIEVDGATIKAGSITNAQLSNVQITDSMLKHVTIDGAKIKAGSITNAQLSNIQVTDAMMRNVTIDGARIRNSSIDMSSLKPGAVTESYDALVNINSSGSAHLFSIDNVQTNEKIFVHVRGSAYFSCCGALSVTLIGNPGGENTHWATETLMPYAWHPLIKRSDNRERTTFSLTALVHYPSFSRRIYVSLSMYYSLMGTKPNDYTEPTVYGVRAFALRLKR